MKPITHVIFDLDGVLLDTEPLYTEAASTICARYGKTYDWSIKIQSMGRGALTGAELTIATLGLPLSPAAYLSERNRLLAELFRRTPDFPGAPELVAALAQRGIRMAVATSSERFLCDIKLANKPWVQHMAAVLCGDDPDLHRLKPDPDIFLLAARRMGAEPSACLVFEDSVSGVEAAERAGMRVIAIPDAHIAEDERFLRAHQLIKHYGELDWASLGLASSS